MSGANMTNLVIAAVSGAARALTVRVGRQEVAGQVPAAPGA
jgi:hypothetical protein